MSGSEKAILQRFRALVSERLRLHKMILFGSRARGDADEFSDMDVVVILDDQPDATAKDHVSDCAWEAGFEHGVVIVPVVFGRWEWENGPERRSLLVQAVEKEGITL